eukprot:m.138431 g.138431  ORF g.138431 m.138431 type:complete len:427 (-) comp20267_c0_seq1:1212-2492(-)
MTSVERAGNLHTATRGKNHKTDKRNLVKTQIQILPAVIARMCSLLGLQFRVAVCAQPQPHDLALAHCAVQQRSSHRVHHMSLNDTVHGAGAVHGIIAFVAQPHLDVVGKLKLHVLVCQPLAKLLQTDFQDASHVFAGQIVEGDNFVDSVDEFGGKVCLKRLHGLGLHARVHSSNLCNSLRAEIAGHNDDGVSEVHAMALGVGQMPIIQHLQQKIGDLAVSLFKFVQQHHRIRAAPHSLRQRPALFIAHITRWGAYQPGHAESLHVLAHVHSHKRILRVKHKLSDGLAQFGLAYSCWPQEHEAGDRVVWLGQPGSVQPHHITDCLDDVVLSDHSLTQDSFHVQQFLALAAQHGLQRNACGPRYHHRNVMRAHRLANQSLAVLARLLCIQFLRFLSSQLLFQLGNVPVLQTTGKRIVAGALGTFQINA